MKQNQQKKTGHKRKHWWLIAAGSVLLVVVLIVLDEIGKRIQSRPVPVISGVLRPVSVAFVEPGNYSATIRTTGGVTARNKIDIRSQVSGKILEVGPQFLPGNRVAKGTLLVHIQDSLLRAQLSETKKRMADARVALLTEQREADQALRNWNRAGLDGKPDSRLVLRQPQLEAANAEIEAARIAIEHAKTELGYSVIRAPFDGIITRRIASPGQMVTLGESLGYLVGTDTLDLAVTLSNRQWRQLSFDWEKQPASLNEIDSNKQWPARIRSAGRIVQEQTRLRQIYLELKPPAGSDTTDMLLPGNFVNVRLPGREYENIYRIPASAYTRDAKIWIVDDKDTLQPLNVDLLFTDNAFVYIELPADKRVAHVIALFPQTGFIAGQKVSPRERPMTAIDGE